MERKYQVGESADPKDTDPWFADDESAVAYASEIAEFEKCIAVWDSDGNAKYLFHLGDQFKRM